MQPRRQLVDAAHAERKLRPAVERAHDVVRLGREDVDARNEVEHALQPRDLAVQKLARALKVFRLGQRKLAEHLGEHGHARTVVEARDLRDGVGVRDAVADRNARHGERLAKRAHHHEVAMLGHEAHHALAAQRELDGALVHHHPAARVQVGAQGGLGQEAARRIARIGQHGRVEADAAALGGRRVGDDEPARTRDLHHAMPCVAGRQRVLCRTRHSHAHGAGLVGLRDGAHHVAHSRPGEEGVRGKPELARERAAQRMRLAIGRVVQLARGQRVLHGADERRGSAEGVRRPREVDPVHLCAKLVRRREQLLWQGGHALAHARLRAGRMRRHRLSFRRSFACRRRACGASPKDVPAGCCRAVAPSRPEGARDEYPSTSRLRAGAAC